MPKYTNYTEGFKGTIDHIFFNEKLTLLSILDVVDEKICKKEKALPSTLLPSDHIRLEATF